MQVQLLVERGQDECVVRLAGTAYKFKRNEHGHLVSDITDHDDLKWVSDPRNGTAFKEYIDPQKNILDEAIDDAMPVADIPDASGEAAQTRTGEETARDVGETLNPPVCRKRGPKRQLKRNGSRWK